MEGIWLPLYDVIRGAWPPLDSYFDDDIRCLVGFHTLVCCLSPSNEELPKIENDSYSMLRKLLSEDIYPNKSTLCKVLLFASPEKCHYFVGQHFLARYLKVRCLIDCNHPRSEVMHEFKKLKSQLPFEHIVRCFLQHKFRQL